MHASRSCFNAVFVSLAFSSLVPASGLTTGSEPVSTERLAVVEARLGELGEREKKVRTLWAQSQKEVVQATRALIDKDEGIRAMQRQIGELLEQARLLQTKLDQRLADSMAAGSGPTNEAGQVGASLTPAELQKEIVALSTERRELMRERERLKQLIGAENPELPTKTSDDEDPE